jgi:hypothetical protein
MNNYDGQLSDDDIPYIVMELDVIDVHQVYQSVSYHLQHWPGGDPYEQERLTALKDFFYRMVLEYKYQISSDEQN